MYVPVYISFWLDIAQLPALGHLSKDVIYYLFGAINETLKMRQLALCTLVDL